MAEQEDLILRVQLDDQASQQLERLRRQVNELGSDSGGMARMRRQTTDSTREFRGLNTEMTAMATRAGVVGGVVAQVSGNTPIALVAHPTRALTMGLRFPRELPVEVLGSSAVAATLLIAVAPAALASATGDITIDASREVGALHMEDQAPLPINETGTLAAPVYSVFQTDSVALKLHMSASWALRDARAVAWLTTTAW
jgi:hypothetical protein